MTDIYAVAHPVYRERGWAPIKLRAGTKFPPPTGFTGRDGAYPSGADMHAWAEEEPEGNTAIRLSVGYLGIDVDAYGEKTGARTLSEAEKRWGRLPYSPRSTSRDDGISGIRIYRVPAGYDAVNVLEFPELHIGDIEIIQPHHRYVMCWPSIHPSGRQYQWLGVDGEPLDEPPTVDDIPDLPAAWVDALRKPEHDSAEFNTDGGTYDVRQALTEGELSRRVAWKLGEAVAACYGPGRHDHTRDNVLALLRMGKQGDTGVSPALKALRKTFVAAVGPDRPGGREQAADEFDKFVFSDRTTRLLAAPDYDDRAHHIGEPPPDVDDHVGEYTPDDQSPPDEPTTWEPFNLGPWLAGDIQQPQPCLGITRSDGQRLIYPGREHAVLGETESGKTWLALGCVAAELAAGNLVVYVHYEEGDPASTIERLRLLGVDTATLAERLRFVAPTRPVRGEWVTALLTPAPALVVHDGVNEAMSLIGADIMAADGAATFRRRLVTPFLRAGAASIACDHLPKERDGRSRDAYGSVHKGNALDGARYVLENDAPFGRSMRGASYLFVTKDRPGQLRAHGRTTKLPGKTFMGTLVVDDMTRGPEFFVRLFAPRDDGSDERPAGLTVTAAELADTMHEVIAALPDRTVGSLRKLYAHMRAAGHTFRESAYRNTVDDLIAAGRVVEVVGKRGAIGYCAVLTAARGEST